MSNNLVEMDNREMLDTYGGLSVFAIAAGIIAVATGINACYNLGKNIGEAIYYVKNR